MKSIGGEYFRVVVFLLLALGVIEGIHAQTPVPLRRYGGNLKTVDVSIQNRSFTFLFDTGGSETIISPEIAQFLNRKVYGRNGGFRMNGEMIKFQRCDNVNLKIGGLLLYFSQVGVLDIMSILPKDFPKLDGIISLQSFSQKKLTIDLRNNQLVVETEKSFARRKNGMTQVAATFSNGLQGGEVNLFLYMPINGRVYRFLFDTGNVDKTRLSPSTATELGFQYETVPKQCVSIGKIKLPVGHKLMETQACVEDIIYDGALDFGFISQSVYTIDLLNKKVWVQGPSN